MPSIYLVKEMSSDGYCEGIDETIIFTSIAENELEALAFAIPYLRDNELKYLYADWFDLVITKLPIGNAQGQETIWSSRADIPRIKVIDLNKMFENLASGDNRLKFMWDNALPSRFDGITDFNKIAKNSYMSFSLVGADQLILQSKSVIANDLEEYFYKRFEM